MKANQAGKRLTGEHVVTEMEIQSGTYHSDTIAAIPARQWDPSIRSSIVYIPYRSLVPRKVENLLVAGRCLSSDQFANNVLSPIQCCVAMGQASGTAAAIAAKKGVGPRYVDYGTLRNSLLDQGVPLPGMPDAWKK